MDTTLLDKYQQALKKASHRASDENIPVGFVVSQSGRFMMKWSLASGGRFYDRLEDLLNDSIPLLERPPITDELAAQKLAAQNT